MTQPRTHATLPKGLPGTRCREGTDSAPHSLHVVPLVREHNKWPLVRLSVAVCSALTQVLVHSLQNLFSTC